MPVLDLHGPLPLPLAMLIVFGSAKLLGEIFRRLNLPGIVGEILAGALVGPHAFAWIGPNEIAPNHTLTALADLGVMFLLFDAGLQIRAADLLEVAGISAVVAVSEVVVTFAATWGAMAAWGGGLTASLVVSSAMVATSVGVTASVLASRGLLDRPVSRIILGAAVIDDVLGLIALSISGSVAGGKANIAGVALTAALAAAFIIVMTRWGTQTAARVLPYFRSRAQAEDAEFHIALVLLFALSALSVYAGVAAIVGAFLAGIALSEASDGRVRDLSRGVAELLTPFFLAGIGLKLDLSVFRSGPLVGLAALLLLVAVGGKIAGCVLGASVFSGVPFSSRRGATHGRAGASKLMWPDGLAIGLGMVPRGEVTLLVAQMGIGLGAIGADLYGGLVLVTVATAVLTPFLLRFDFLGQRRGGAAQEGIRLK